MLGQCLVACDEFGDGGNWTGFLMEQDESGCRLGSRRKSKECAKLLLLLFSLTWPGQLSLIRLVALGGRGAEIRNAPVQCEWLPVVRFA